MANLLSNPGFEADWSEEESHDVAILRPGEDADLTERSNIFTPPGWLTWFVHVPGTWDQPEVRDAHIGLDERRVRSGSKAIVLFSFNRNHDAGLLAWIQTEPGQMLRFSAWPQAWSNHDMESGRPDDPYWSDGAGDAIMAWPEGSFSGNTGDEQEDAKPNHTFSVGIDPTGHGDPRAPSVVWGPGFHVYNGYPRQLQVTALAQAQRACVFLRGVTLWAFKHNDNYWDDAEAVVIDVPERVYHRTYALLPQAMGGSKASQLFAEHFKDRQTVGFSADDAFVQSPRLKTNTVIVYDAETSYPGGREGLRKFAQTVHKEPDTWIWRSSAEEPQPPPPPPPPPAGELGATLHLQTMSHEWDVYVREAKPTACKVLPSLQDALGVRRANPGTLPVVRLYDPREFDYCFGYPNTPEGQREGARAFIRRHEDSMHDIADQLEREHPGLRPPYYALECLNEGYATDGPHTAQIILFETAFAELMAQLEPRVAPVTFCGAVGNPGEWEFAQLIPLARATAAANGFLGYHGYWFANQSETGMTAEHQPYLHGRWMEIDKVLVRAGIRARWFLGESGAVGGRLIRETAKPRALTDEALSAALPMWAYGARPRVFYVPLAAPLEARDLAREGNGFAYQLLPHDGWLSLECYNGDLDAYIADAVIFEGINDEWNADHEGRCWGWAFFTTGESYTGWPSFQFREREMQALMSALGMS